MPDLDALYFTMEIENDPAPRVSGSIVEVEEEKRGKYLTVGSPIKFSDFTPKDHRRPLLGEHTDQVLTQLGYRAEQIAKMCSNKFI
jgi:formyl-CoA transferase